MTDQEFAALFQEIVERTQRLYASEAALGGRQLKLLPAASDEHIQAMAKAIPAPMPNSYARFLRLHDGCLGFWELDTLLGTKGRPRKLIAERVALAIQQQGPEVLLSGSAATVTPEAIAAFEASGEDFYVPAYVLFGTGDGGRCLIFNHKKRDSQGEPEVVDYSLESKVRARHPSFEAYLRATLEVLLRRGAA